MSAAEWLFLVVLVGVVGQAGFIWWAHARHERSYRDAERQLRKQRAELVETAYDKMTGNRDD